MLGCYRKDEWDACARAAFTDIQILEKVDLRLRACQYCTSRARTRTAHHDLAQLRLWNVAERDLLDGDRLAGGPVEGAFVGSVSDGASRVACHAR